MTFMFTYPFECISLLDLTYSCYIVFTDNRSGKLYKESPNMLGPVKPVEPATFQEHYEVSDANFHSVLRHTPLINAVAPGTAAFTNSHDFDEKRLWRFLKGHLEDLALRQPSGSSREANPTRLFLSKHPSGNTFCANSRRESFCRARTPWTASSASSRR